MGGNRPIVWDKTEKRVGLGTWKTRHRQGVYCMEPSNVTVGGGATVEISFGYGLSGKNLQG